MFRIKTILFFIVAFLLLTGCSNESTAEKIYTHLEEAVTIEDAVTEQQQQIAELEQKEQGLYNKMIELKMEEFSQIKELSNEAIAVLEEKEELINNEKESMDSAKKEFEKVESMVKNVEEESASSTAESLVSVMNERYEAYSKVYDYYKQAIEEDKKLYQMMQKEDITEEQIREQVNIINENYEKVLTGHQTFNEKTKKYNQLKKDFYNSAGLKVEYADQETNQSQSASE